mmetsp:Transcript_25046/g.73182  ORF Transcript_25046/g.73182 Transcript_25046/m.73182 type:complete len:308 (+) Transcript_25046:556-1479(+)
MESKLLVPLAHSVQPEHCRAALVRGSVLPATIVLSCPTIPSSARVALWTSFAPSVRLYQLRCPQGIIPREVRPTLGTRNNSANQATTAPVDCAVRAVRGSTAVPTACGQVTAPEPAPRGTTVRRRVSLPHSLPARRGAGLPQVLGHHSAPACASQGTTALQAQTFRTSVNVAPRHCTAPSDRQSHSTCPAATTRLARTLGVGPARWPATSNTHPLQARTGGSQSVRARRPHCRGRTRGMTRSLSGGKRAGLSTTRDSTLKTFKRGRGRGATRVRFLLSLSHAQRRALALCPVPVPPLLLVYLIWEQC